jgi:hypothetical protein
VRFNVSQISGGAYSAALAIALDLSDAEVGASDSAGGGPGRRP